MSYSHARSLIAAVLACLLLVTSGISLAAAQETPPSPQCDRVTPGLVNDYLYGYAPVVMWATKSLFTAVPDATTIEGLAPINQFARLQTLALPARTFVPRPNTDTLYTLAWLDLRQEPMMLHVPETAGRYYLMPMLDAYSNEFASIGSRTTGTGAGDFAIVGPSWRKPLPAGVQVVRAPTNTVWIIGRTLVHGQADLPAVRALTAQYQLIPLSAYPDFLATGSYTPPTNVAVTPPPTDFVGPPITASKGLMKPEFFDVLARITLQNPPPVSQLREALPLVADGFIHQLELSQDTLDAVLAAIADDAQNRIVQNGWSFDLRTGNYGNCYTHRALTAATGLGANIAADAVYPSTSRDETGADLNGANSYVIHFPASQTPPVRGFWSVTAYDSNGFLVANAIQRYSLGSESGLVPNADGSIDILLQSTTPATLQSNWLPVPLEAFNLTLRMYWPEDAVLNGTFVIPPVQLVSSGSATTY